MLLFINDIHMLLFINDIHMLLFINDIHMLLFINIYTKIYVNTYDNINHYNIVLIS